jgi:uncharacterized Zn finger protein (UPF0148 family)
MVEIFRTKKTKVVKEVGVQGTLDFIHTAAVRAMREAPSRTPADVQKDIDALEPSNSIQYTKLCEERDALLKKRELTDYYMQNADILMQYYGGATTSAHSTETNTFMKFLAPVADVSKKDLFNEYAVRMKLQPPAVEPDMSSDQCGRCNITREEVPEEGLLVCPSCGSEERTMTVSDIPSFRDPPKERNNYSYKKINHLNEIMNQFQAKESTIIPDEVMHEIVCELKKRRIQNIADLTEKDIKDVLKKIERSNLYEHAAYIVWRLNGNPPPTITPEQEEKIRALFQEIQTPFFLFCPTDRKNLLSYQYILYKLFELLEMDEYKYYFSLLKSRDRLIEHEQMWKQICEYLRWEFIASV